MIIECVPHSGIGSIERTLKNVSLKIISWLLVLRKCIQVCNALFVVFDHVCVAKNYPRKSRGVSPDT